jgi:hypothetical protein
MNAMTKNFSQKSWSSDRDLNPDSREFNWKAIWPWNNKTSTPAAVKRVYIISWSTVRQKIHLFHLLHSRARQRYRIESPAGTSLDSWSAQDSDKRESGEMGDHIFLNRCSRSFGHLWRNSNVY